MAGPLAGAGLGILKSELIDRPKEARERELAATTAALNAYRPGAPMAVNVPEAASWENAAMQGAVTGAADGGGGGGSPWSAMAAEGMAPEAGPQGEASPQATMAPPAQDSDTDRQKASMRRRQAAGGV